ncbi:unnamed protein product [Strongylus vulgaris]|uniref:Uncharacterized protein n=1 Tax=Strongylus vulgaris TaxID=40348 RepID=A0A3P7J266_STRVU|nr:unnamed protein product [Strongylus vulgaris]
MPNGVIPLDQKARAEIPLDCWQPAEDKRPEPAKIVNVRTPKKPKRPKDIDVQRRGSGDALMDKSVRAEVGDDLEAGL